MVNSEAFTERLEKILDYYDLSASALADKIGIGRSSISHIISGRNKPSLDFTLKILKAFPEIDLYWLLNGRGEFPPKEPNAVPPGKPLKNIPDQSSLTKTDKPSKNTQKLSSPKKRIDKIIIFYEDGSFETYQNQS